jgi:hypothetical protein
LAILGILNLAIILSTSFVVELHGFWLTAGKCVILRLCMGRIPQKGDGGSRTTPRPRPRESSSKRYSPPTSFASAEVVAREAALAAAKKDGQNKNAGAAGRMTLQERLAASIAKSRTGSPKAGAVGETGTSAVEEEGEGNSNGVLKVSVPNSPVRTETPRLPVTPTKFETLGVVEAVEDVPSRTETPDISVIPPTDSIPPLPLPPEQPEESQTSQTTDPQPIDLPSPAEPPIQVPSPSPRTSTTSIPPDTDPATLDLITQLRNDLATCESRRIEESQTASARISSLEDKLKLLSQTTLDHSKDLAANPTASSWERKLGDREEKIALLLDEGYPSPSNFVSTVDIDCR